MFFSCRGAKPTAPAYFFGVKLMFVGVVNFGQVQKIRFVGVNIFWSCSNPNFGELHWSSSSVMLTSLIKNWILTTIFFCHQGTFCNFSFQIPNVGLNLYLKSTINVFKYLYFNYILNCFFGSRSERQNQSAKMFFLSKGRNW